jgi:Phosphotransferase enzyme family
VASLLTVYVVAMPTRNQSAALRADMTRRGAAAAVAVAGRYGIRVEEPEVLADLFSLRVHLRPAPIVARVPTWLTRLRTNVAGFLRREIEVTSYLAAQGAPVVTCSPELPAGPHTYGGFAISFWTYHEPDPDRAVTADECAAMAIDLHAALVGYPGRLPDLVPKIIDTGAWLPLADRADEALSAADHELLHTAAQRVVPLLEGTAAARPLHGDLHPGNLLSTRSGPLWIDFEDVSRGPLEWDLAAIVDTAAVAAHHSPDPDVLSACHDARMLQVALCLAGLYDIFGDSEGWAHGLRGCLDALRPTPQ